jgi:hypothetical protein
VNNVQSGNPIALDRKACFEYLDRVAVGRVGLSIDALPVVLPLHFIVADESLLVQTIRGTKLDSAILGAVVAFQADAEDPRSLAQWSVLVQGIATELAEVSNLSGFQWALPFFQAPRDFRCIRIDAAVVTGRLFPAA